MAKNLGDEKELEQVSVHANGPTEEEPGESSAASGQRATLVADVVAAVLTALEARSSPAVGAATQTWTGSWAGQHGEWKRDQSSGEWKL